MGPKDEETTAKTVEVTFEKQCETQMVTVCQPAQYGYGHGYGHNYCKEVGQETCYNVPVVTVVEPVVTVTYPEPIKTCVNKPISLPRISCEDLSEEKCITVPEVEDVSETFSKCVTGLTPRLPGCGAHPPQAGLCGDRLRVRPRRPQARGARLPRPGRPRPLRLRTSERA